MRDQSLDLLKGAACVLMLFAHTQLQIDLPSKALTFLGSFAPILFFAVSGITANFQARRHPVTGVVLTYVMIFLLGLSFASMVVGNFWVSFDMDILQIIAVGALTLYLVQRYLNPGHWFHLGAAVAIFALKPLTDLLPRESEWVAPLVNVVIEPGNFVIIPWLFPFFLGMFCHLAPNRHNLWLAAASLLALGLAWGLLGYWGLPLGIDNRWDMTIGYFLCSLFITSAAFFVARRLPQSLISSAFVPLLWLGRQSLLFLYVHIGLIWLIRRFTEGIWGSYWIWPLVALLSVVLMWLLPPLLAALRIPRLMQRFPAWLVLLALVLVAPLVLPDGAPLVLAQLLLGVVFSLYYGEMTRALKGIAWPAARQSRGVAE
ncbi:acyltransferase family protein [Thiohalocapsa marina]|nr:acyltransferase family protein [Thiohalocapsa marina]